MGGCQDMYHDAHDVFGEKDQAINIFFVCVQIGTTKRGKNDP